MVEAVLVLGEPVLLLLETLAIGRLIEHEVMADRLEQRHLDHLEPGNEVIGHGRHLGGILRTAGREDLFRHALIIGPDGPQDHLSGELELLGLCRDVAFMLFRLGIGQYEIGGGSGYLQPALAQRALISRHERREDDEVREAPVVRRDDTPWCVIGRGGREDLIEHLAARIVSLRVLEVALGDTPGGLLVGGELLETFALLLLADMEEELEDDIPVIGELPLIALDGLDVGHEDLAELLCLPLALKAGKCILVIDPFAHLAQGAPIPTLVEDRERAMHARLRPERLDEGEPLLLLGGLVRRHVDREGAGIEIADEVADAAALARCIPALEEHDGGNLLADGSLLQQDQT